MKTPLFARPNMKVFFLSALAIAVVKETVLPDSATETPHLIASHSLHLTPRSDAEIAQLIDQSLRSPSAQLYFFISDSYRLRGEYDRAMFYLRKASLAADLEEQTE